MFTVQPIICLVYILIAFQSLLVSSSSSSLLFQVSPYDGHNLNHRIINPCNISLELLYLQDLTANCLNVSSVLKSALPELFAFLNTKFPYSRFGVASFRDKPLPGLGDPDDYCFRLHLPLEPFGMFRPLMYNSGGGGNWPHNQLDAISRAALSERSGFSESPNVLRAIVLSTNSISNPPGIAATTVAKYNAEQPSNFRSSAAPFSELATSIASLATNVNYACATTEYPTADEMGNVLKQKGIVPIVALSPPISGFHNILNRELLNISTLFNGSSVLSDPELGSAVWYRHTLQAAGLERPLIGLVGRNLKQLRQVVTDAIAAVTTEMTCSNPQWEEVVRSKRHVIHDRNSTQLTSATLPTTTSFTTSTTTSFTTSTTTSFTTATTTSFTTATTTSFTTSTTTSFTRATTTSFTTSTTTSFTTSTTTSFTTTTTSFTTATTTSFTTSTTTSFITATTTSFTTSTTTSFTTATTATTISFTTSTTISFTTATTATTSSFTTSTTTSFTTATTTSFTTATTTSVLREISSTLSAKNSATIRATVSASNTTTTTISNITTYITTYPTSFCTAKIGDVTDSIQNVSTTSVQVMTSEADIVGFSIHSGHASATTYTFPTAPASNLRTDLPPIIAETTTDTTTNTTTDTTLVPLQLVLLSGSSIVATALLFTLGMYMVKQHREKSCQIEHPTPAAQNQNCSSQSLDSSRDVNFGVVAPGMFA